MGCEFRLYWCLRGAFPRISGGFCKLEPVCCCYTGTDFGSRPLGQVGGSFGAAAGLVLMENLPMNWNIQPGIYAIVGATAMLGGVFRSSISLVRLCCPPACGLCLPSCSPHLLCPNQAPCRCLCPAAQSISTELAVSPNLPSPCQDRWQHSAMRVEPVRNACTAVGGHCGGGHAGH